MTTKTVGDCIRETREAKGISQKTLRIRTGVSQKSISRIENGLDSPRMSTLLKIAHALDMRVVLLDEDDKMTPLIESDEKEAEKAL